MQLTRFASIPVVIAALACTSVYAADATDTGDETVRLQETIISGNQELPKVLYIQPWDDASALPDLGIDPDLDMSDVLTRVYAPAYRRELGLHDRLQAMEASP